MKINGKNTVNDPRFILLFLGLLLFLTIIVSFCIGRYPIPIGQILSFIMGKPVSEQILTILFNIRLPRILLACMVGCCLSTAGACFQGVFQNPMASPDILGASSGAGFGAALAILFGASSAFITGSAFAFSITAVFLVFVIAQRAPGSKIVNLILAGIMISSIFTALTSYIKLVSDPGQKLPAITYWLMGSLSGARLTDVAFAAIPMIIGLIALFALRWQINLLTLGEDEASALGVSTNITRLFILLFATLITAASISVSGMIGWVGLVIPHLCRKLVGHNYRFLIPASMLAGAEFLLLTDNISRNLFVVEIPIGILTALIGAPFFIYLILRKEKTL